MVVKANKYPFKGGLYTSKEISEMANFPLETLRVRIGNHYPEKSIEEIVSIPIFKPTLYNYKGKDYTISQLSEVAGKSEYCLMARIRKYGWSVEKAVETPLYLTKKQKLEQEIRKKDNRDYTDFLNEPLDQLADRLAKINIYR